MSYKTLIAVPSLGRAYDFMKHTGFWLQELQNTDYCIFIEPREELYYRQVLPYGNFVVTENEIGLKGQIKAIQSYAKSKQYKYVMKCDDDMWFLRKQMGKKKTAITLEDALDEIESEMDKDEWIGGVTITKAAGYIRNPEHKLWLYKKDKPF